MTKLFHTLTHCLLRYFNFAQLHRRCFAQAQSALYCKRFGTKFLSYLHFYTAQNINFETRSVCAHAARHIAYFKSFLHPLPSISHICTECKNAAQGGIDPAFFCFFSTKTAYFSTFLLIFEHSYSFLHICDRREQVYGTLSLLLHWFYGKIPGWARGRPLYQGL